MGHEVTLFELFITGGGSLSAVAAAWIHMRINVATLKSDLKNLQERFEEEKSANKEKSRRIFEKMDAILETVNEIKVTVAKK